MMRHQKTAHGQEHGQEILCCISTCALKIHNVATLVDHLRNFHGACIVERNSLKEQEYIKIQVQCKAAAKSVNKDGCQSYTFVCYRDGGQTYSLEKG